MRHDLSIRSPLHLSLGLLAGLLGTALLAGSARAALPPISDEELARRSELIVDGRVQSQSCAGTVKRTAPGAVVTEVRYVSVIEVTAVIKGTPPAGWRYRGYKLMVDVPFVGPIPPPPLPVGWVGRLHLVPVEPGIYQPTHEGSTLKENQALSRPAPHVACSNDGGVPDVGVSDGGVSDVGVSDSAASDVVPADNQAPTDSGGSVRPDATADVTSPADGWSADASADGGGKVDVDTMHCGCDLGGASRAGGGRTMGVFALAFGLLLGLRRRRRRSR